MKIKLAAAGRHIKWMFAKIACRFLGHSWKELDGNFAKRRCSRCTRRESMYQSLYPSLDEPSLRWEGMGYDHRV